MQIIPAKLTRYTSYDEMHKNSLPVAELAEATRVPTQPTCLHPASLDRLDIEDDLAKVSAACHPAVRVPSAFQRQHLAQNGALGSE